MSTDNKAQVTAERDAIRPMDNHQPIIAPGVTPRAKKKKPGERDIVKPMDNHQPIAATGITTEDNHQPLGEPK
ncbi:hypothetical protein ACFC0M_25620 [Streptomyces sp. NPDC056149]|uniref:hypothetical protein n=1 Tax=unclassified Streptomyces TaxID=2593676 RepID=UPI00238109E5|nr:hypothetical protein [Streptomyces sp. WZ-12]